MTVAAGAAAQGTLAERHADLLRDRAFQFTLPDKPPDPPPAETPEWLKAIGRFFEMIAPGAEWVFWGVLALIVGVILFFVGREVVRSRWAGRHRPVVLTQDDSWRPTAAQAQVLLADADALAAAGRFAEAAHLLLRRSVQEIAQARPRLVRPALTSRDIAGHPDLPGAARTAFAAIARVVERSRFGERPVAESDWRDARAAYAGFALPGAPA